MLRLCCSWNVFFLSSTSISPADVRKTNHFYYTDGEVGFGGEGWILKSFTTFCSPKSQVSIQENAGAAADGRLQLAFRSFFSIWNSYPPPTVTIVESPDMKSSLDLRFFLFSSSSSSSESGCTHRKCSMPDFVNLEEKLIRQKITIYTENVDSVWPEEKTLSCAEVFDPHSLVVHLVSLTPTCRAESSKNLWTSFPRYFQALKKPQNNLWS